MGRSARLLLLALVPLAVVGAAAIAWRARPARQTFYTDADTIREPRESARPRDILWQPPVKLPVENINTTAEDYEPRFSWDGLTLFFVRGKAGDNADIYRARRTPTGWTEPEPLIELNGPYDELGPSPSADGESLYFYSNRLGGTGGYDLWVARLAAPRSPAYGEAINLGGLVNSEFNDYGPAVSPDGTCLYFASNRPQPGDARQPDPDAWPATVREDLFHRTYDLYVAVITDRGVGPARPIRELNTPFNEGPPAVSPAGDFLYFSSDRPGGFGKFDLYRSRRLHGTHRPPANLGAVVNGPANELDPALTLGGYALYFSSDRPAERLGSEAPNDYNLYRTVSREVFTAVEERRRPAIDWAALWTQIGPNVFWALLALLLLLLLLAFWNVGRSRRLSLLVRCLLASLIAHCLLMVLLNFWQVTTTLAEALRRRGGIQVALVSPARGSDISAQILAPLTDAEAPAPREPISDRPTTMPPPERLTSSAELAVDRRPPETHEVPGIKPELSDAPEPGFQPPAPETSLARLEPAPPAELSLPAETSRIDAREERTVQPPASSSPDAIARRTVDVIDPAPQRAAHVALAPDDSPGTATQALEHPRVDTTTIRDAAVVAPPRLAAAVPAIDPSAPPAISIALPTEQQPPIEEERPRVTAPVAEGTPRAVPTFSPAASAGGMATIRIDPGASGFEPAPRTPKPAWADQLADARTADPPGGRPQVAADHQAALPTVEVSVPPLEESSAGGRPKDSPTYAPTIPSSPRLDRAAFLHEVTHWRPRSIVALTPRGLDPAPPEPDRVVSAGAGIAAEVPVPRRPIPPAAETALFPLPDTPSLHLRLPTETPASGGPPERYAQRSPVVRRTIVEQMGGSEETELAVARALNWLARHQSPDGRWDADAFDERCGACDGQSEYEVDIALTGLSLLCFLGADHTHVKEGEYRDPVRRGLDWLLGRQRTDGDLRGEDTMYSHGIAAITLSEAYGMTGDAALADPVRRAVAFISRARNKRVGGWRYDPGQVGDTSVLGWQVMALTSARLAGIEVPAEDFEGARHWLDRVSKSSAPGLYAYQPQRAVSPAMTAEGMFTQQLLGLSNTEPRMRASAAFLLGHLPDWESHPLRGGSMVNTYYWYYATLALFQHQGPEWNEWNEALTGQLLKHQETRPGAEGSWPPVGRWASTGGRVYQTALCTLMLEVYYRYLPLFAQDRAAPSVGTISGQVTDAGTGWPLGGATVRLDLPRQLPLTASTDDDGRYHLSAPPLPDFVALSASADGYVPATANVATAKLPENGLVQDFQLRRREEQVIVLEAVPEVHHLGNDRFEGAINSQFQKDSEGSTYRASFDVPSDYRIEDGAAEVWMLTRGVQCPHEIRVNGRLLDRRLSSSPADGSFGDFAAAFPAALLNAGTNTIQIRAISCRDDLDDFEFVNLQIRLAP